MNLFATLFTLVRRDLTLALRHKSELLTALFFFVIVVNLLPLGVGPDPKLLSKIAPGVVWIGALLATLLGLPRLFAHDYQDGTLEQLSLSPHSFTVIILGKIMAHWLVAGLPVVLITPLLGIQFNLSGPIIGVLMLTLLLGTPILSLIGSIGAALTLGVRGGGVLLSLLILPLYIPVLIFGAGATEAYRAGLDMSGYFWLLAALDLLALFFAPWVSAIALKVALE
ncbi:MAG: heme exporter protein CcmB [Ferrovum sp. 37-45-19]|uniref:heme exporter protein CcmB n=1 Tax=Ferrovum sp. JA12 TaxID=1356299 RepID=UPI0007030392|nr:heme exporter protein CcmB [Ferrovum sp. JA12]OYV79761.1 MAG: heme exporter protein CcmB [Ferrovum sp. 21-44-67]OYV95383.1 MAG: heme exporter protein CcmB [Ferrovum sp. 37-45-19]OZB31442.1 MAG: heme exporter protein CcmB [Ferrovum sp. 34-44-207]HQT81173.1 heme exporter protein CcmB [Ferrovaceae bacterium]KRH78060.1 heme exporter protein B [Ferrovum sp. JA12]